MFLAEAANEVSSGVDKGFNYFVILFTILIAYGVFKSVTAPRKNMFAIGFGTVCLLVFLAMDAIMVAQWLEII